MTWINLKPHLPTLSGVVGAVVLATLLLGTETGRDALGWIYLQSTQAIDRSIHFAFPLDSGGPNLPAVHVVQPG